MKTKNILGLFLFGCLALASCKKELEPQESSSDPKDSLATAQKANPATPLATPTPNATPGQMPQPTGQVTTTTTPQPVAAPVAVAKGMNPSHGQPGHRCDIAVGAPLNSPPGKATATPATQNPAIKMNPASTGAATIIPAGTSATPNTAPALLQAPAEVAAGMNPAHGQPGHRCDVAVGQPLPKS